jgi:hypothetical protein
LLVIRKMQPQNKFDNETNMNNSYLITIIAQKKVKNESFKLKIYSLISPFPHLFSFEILSQNTRKILK